MSEQSGSNKQPLIAATTTTGGDALALANPEGINLIITRLIIDITTPATGAATVDAGIAADGQTSDDTLLDGLDVGTAAILADNHSNPGTNGRSLIKWGANQYLTITPSATLAGLVGNAYIEWVRE